MNTMKLRQNHRAANVYPYGPLGCLYVEEAGDLGRADDGRKIVLRSRTISENDLAFQIEGKDAGGWFPLSGEFRDTITVLDLYRSARDTARGGFVRLVAIHPEAGRCVLKVAA